MIHTWFVIKDFALPCHFARRDIKCHYETHGNMDVIKGKTISSLLSCKAYKNMGIQVFWNDRVWIINNDW